MNLKNNYIKEKNKIGLYDLSVKSAGISLFLILLAGLFWITQYLWNFVAPVWGLPQLSYLQVVSTVVLIQLIRGFLFGVIQPKSKSQKIKEMIAGRAND